MMKKLIVILAALALIVSAGCAAAPAETTTVPTQQTTVPTTEVTTVPETTIPETTAAVAELTLVDNEHCTVIIKSYDGDALLGYGVNVYLENKTDKELVFSLGEVSVNGYMCDPFWATTVSAGKKANEQITLWISKSNHPIYIKVENNGKPVSEIHVKSVRKQEGIDDYAFRFNKSLYPNAEIIDLR